MSGSYERVRDKIFHGSKAAAPFFIAYATTRDGLTSSAITMAALNVPVDRASELLYKEVSELDALVKQFTSDMQRQIDQEKLGGLS